jgi:3-phenylpropionate/trans-cinnamate dioxygenase ferredoxin reductase subunit
MDNHGMVIIGAGIAGARAAHALRQEGWKGEITLISEEDQLPYDRPPLSKNALLDSSVIGDYELYPVHSYFDNNINLRLGASVTQIDRKLKCVQLNTGQILPYKCLLLAMGSQPRPLLIKGADLEAVRYLRTKDDAYRIKQLFKSRKKILIIGGGFIGLEVAAAAAMSGCSVTVVEAGNRPMMRSVPAEVAQIMVQEHLRNGVNIKCDVQIEELFGEYYVQGARLSDGSTELCELVVVGVGVLPRTEIADSCGLIVDNGIVVDKTLRTNDSNIFAVGDVCSFPSASFNTRIRLESWKNAEDQAKFVAQNMLGAFQSYNNVPWFWSDQYEMSIHIAGLPLVGVKIVEKRIKYNSRVFFSIDGNGFLVGASGIGQRDEIAREIRLAQMLIFQRFIPDLQMISDPKINLKIFLRKV